MWGSMAGAWLGRDPKTEKTHVGPALLHALSSGLNPFGFPFYSNSVNGGLGVTGQRHTPTSHAGRPPRRHRSGRAGGRSCCPFTSGGLAAAGPSSSRTLPHRAGRGRGALLPRGHHTPATGGWGGGSPGACVPPGGLEHAGQCEVQPCPGAQGRLLRPPLPDRGCPGWGPSPPPPLVPDTSTERRSRGREGKGPLELEPTGLSLPGQQRDPGLGPPSAAGGPDSKHCT